MSTFLFWTVFVLIIAFAVLVSLVRGVVTHTSAMEVELLRKKHPRAAATLDIVRDPRANLIPALGVLYSSAAGLSAALAGLFAGWKLMAFQEDFGKLGWWVWPTVLAGAILAALLVTCSTGLVPRKIGGHTRHFWQPRLARLAWVLHGLTTPLRALASQLDTLAPPPDEKHDTSDEEIRELARRNVREGKLTEEESTLVFNAVRLDDIPVRDIMTPRSVVTALEASLTVGDVLRQLPNLPHGRMPMYEGSLDNVRGIVRRRDLLQAKANGREKVLVRTLADKGHFVPENAMVSAALRDLVRNHQYIAVVVDEFGSVSGVVTLEDIFECLIGAEIFEKDDVAVNMRALARAKVRNEKPGARKVAPAQ